MSPVVSPHPPSSSDSSKSRDMRASSSVVDSRPAYPTTDDLSVLCPTNCTVFKAGFAASSTLRYSASERHVRRSPRIAAQSELSRASP